MPKLAEMRVDHYTLPLPEPIEAYAAGLMRAFDMVAVRITDADGTAGVGYTVMHEGQGGSIAAVADGPFRDAIMGEDADRLEWLWRRMYRRVRVEAMRAHLPAEIEIMADANEAWRVDEAVRAMQGLRAFDLVSLEEPIAPDNLDGYAHLRRLGLVPLAAGENLHTVPEFTALIAAGGVDFPEPDLTTCGGITPFMKIARLAEAHGLPVISHGAHDLHVHLLAACPNAAYLEWHAFGLDRFMAEPLTLRDGYAAAPERPGHGISFDWERLAAHRAG